MFPREGHFSGMGEAAWCSGNLLVLREETRKILTSAPLHASCMTRAGHYSLSSLSFLTCKKDNYPLPHQIWWRIKVRTRKGGAVELWTDRRCSTKVSFPSLSPLFKTPCMTSCYLRLPWSPVHNERGSVTMLTSYNCERRWSVLENLNRVIRRRTSQLPSIDYKGVTEITV